MDFWGRSRFPRWELWDPISKNTGLLNGMREVFSMGLKVLGHSINTTDENPIRPSTGMKARRESVKLRWSAVRT